MTTATQTDEEARKAQQQEEIRIANERFWEWQKKDLMEAEAKHRIKIINMKNKFRSVKIY